MQGIPEAIRNALFFGILIWSMVMAVKKSSGNGNKSKRKSDASGKTPSDSGRGRRIALFCILLLLLLGVAVGLIAILLKVPDVLLNRNKRFELKRIRVISTGFWNGKEREIAEYIKVAPGQGQSVFTINVGDVRKRIGNIQSIDSCEADIILPDTLELNLTERVPRAMLYPATHIVVDEYGNQFKRSESSAANRVLPMLYDLRGNEAFAKQIKPALTLIMTAIKDYPDISIKHISLRSARWLKVYLVYREQVKCNVLFPISEDYHFLLNTLQSAILNSRGNLHNFDLRYNGQVIIPR